MNLYNVSLLCFTFCSLLLGMLVWLKRQDEIGKRYLIMSVFYSGWSIFIAVNLNNTVSDAWGLFAGRLGNGFAIFIPVLWYHFVVTYSGRVNNCRQVVRFLYCVSIAIACFTFSPWFIPKVAPMVGFKYYSQAGPLYYLQGLNFFIVVPLSFVELYRKIKISDGSESRQAKGLFLAALFGYLGGSPTFFPIFGIPLPQYTLFLLPLYPFSLAYFMIKQKLFDEADLAQAAHRDKLMAIGVLAASINHEVRNPLYVIKGQAESWLERQKEGVFPNEKKVIESAGEVFSKTMQQADRAMDIIKRLSLFAKSGVDNEIKFENIRIRDVLEDVISLVRYELATHNIALSREIPADLPEVRADRRYLEEILFNLIVNAAQATKGSEKPGEIKISAIFENDKLQLEIADNGPGIPEDKIKDVFRPFYTTKEEGTGLGLYITKQLIERNGGAIQVYSCIGRGTSFRTILPRAGK